MPRKGAEERLAACYQRMQDPVYIGGTPPVLLGQSELRWIRPRHVGRTVLKAGRISVKGRADDRGMAWLGSTVGRSFHRALPKGGERWND